MILGSIISILTFPGLIVKVILQSVYVKVFNIAQVSSSSVNKEKLEFDYSLRALVGKLAFQFIILSILAIISNLALRELDNEMRFGEGNTAATIVWWLGFSFGIHSFPNIAEGKYAWQKAKKHEKKMSKGFWYALALAIFIAALIEYFWGSILYTMGLYWLVKLV